MTSKSNQSTSQYIITSRLQSNMSTSGEVNLGRKTTWMAGNLPKKFGKMHHFVRYSLKLQNKAPECQFLKSSRV